MENIYLLASGLVLIVPLITTIIYFCFEIKQRKANHHEGLDLFFKVAKVTSIIGRIGLLVSAFLCTSACVLDKNIEGNTPELYLGVILMSYLIIAVITRTICKKGKEKFNKSNPDIKTIICAISTAIITTLPSTYPSCYASFSISSSFYDRNPFRRSPC